MNKLKENLLKQQELNKELMSLISNLEEFDYSNSEKLEIQKISEDNINLDIDNITLLRNRYIKLINNPNTNDRQKKALTMAIIKIDDMKNNYKKLEKELLKSEKEILNNETINERPVDKAIKKNDYEIKSDGYVKSFERNIGFYLINFIGLILVILGICTFGKYVYSNYMNDLIKGIFLYLISIATLLLGDILLKNKNPKFSEGITGLGLCMLYMSTFINYLFLGNLNEIVAIITSLLISSLGIYISHKKDSGIIRIISLLGGLITLMPTSIDGYVDGYNVVQSLMLIFFTIILNVLSAYKPITKNEKIIINTTSIINFLFLSISMLFMNESVIILLFVFNVLYNHYLFIKNDVKEENLIIFNIVSFLIPVVSLGLDTIPVAILLVVYIGLLFQSKRKISYLLNVFILIDFLVYNNIYSEIINSIIFAVIPLFIAYIDNEKPNILYKIAYVLEFFCLMCVTSELDNILIFLIMNTVTFVSLFMYIRQKEGKMFKTIKYYAFINLILGLFATLQDYDIADNVVILIAVIILGCSIYIFNNIDLIKDKNIKIDNLIWLCFTVFLSFSLMIEFDIISLIGGIFVTICLFIFIDEEYIKINNKNKNIKDIVIPVYIMLNILALGSILNDILTILLLMVLAVTVVYIGFSNRNVVSRKVGVGIAIFTILKLLITSFSMNYIGRTITFIIVGILSLTIAFIYSEIDKKYKEK